MINISQIGNIENIFLSCHKFMKNFHVLLIIKLKLIFSLLEILHDKNFTPATNYYSATCSVACMVINKIALC